MDIGFYCLEVVERIDFSSLKALIPCADPFAYTLFILVAFVLVGVVIEDLFPGKEKNNDKKQGG
jgi:hypothetical protein